MTKSEEEIRAYVEAYSDRYDHDREPPLEFSYLRMLLLILDHERKRNDTFNERLSALEKINVKYRI